LHLFCNHPGGSFDTYPVNSFEAESRKMSRFWDFATPSTSIEVREIGKRRYQIKLRLLDFL
jgi:uncharacterized protein (DUF2126 family)